MQMEIRNQFCDHLIKIGQITETLAAGSVETKSPSVQTVRPTHHQLLTIPENLADDSASSQFTSITIESVPEMPKETQVIQQLHRPSPLVCCLVSNVQEGNEFYEVVKFPCPDLAVLEDEIAMI